MYIKKLLYISLSWR